MATYSLSPAQGVKAAERYASYSFPYPDVRLAFPAAMRESGLPFLSPVTHRCCKEATSGTGLPIGQRPTLQKA